MAKLRPLIEIDTKADSVVTVVIKVPAKDVGEFISSWNIDYVQSLIQFAEVESARMVLPDGTTIELDRF